MMMCVCVMMMYVCVMTCVEQSVERVRRWTAGGREGNLIMTKGQLLVPRTRNTCIWVYTYWAYLNTMMEKLMVHQKKSVQTAHTSYQQPKSGQDVDQIDS